MNLDRLVRKLGLLAIGGWLVWAVSGPLGAQSILPRHACLTAEQREKLRRIRDGG